MNWEKLTQSLPKTRPSVNFSFVFETCIIGFGLTPPTTPIWRMGLKGVNSISKINRPFGRFFLLSFQKKLKKQKKDFTDKQDFSSYPQFF